MTHPELVKALAKPGEEILKEVSSADLHLLHMVLGIAGEAGELVDAIKRAVIYRKFLNIKNVIEELGDLEFYMEGLRTALGISREETIQENISKLSTRYKDLKYTNNAAIERADKNEV